MTAINQLLTTGDSVQQDSFSSLYFHCVQSLRYLVPDFDFLPHDSMLLPRTGLTVFSVSAFDRTAGI